MSRTRLGVAAAIAVVVSATIALSAQMDLSGAWGQRFHEDLPERGAGPDIGDYLGLPINDAARQRADSWDAAKWTMPERQCEPHPADYAPRGPASMRISSTIDPVSQDVTSWHTTLMWMLPHRAIYMDGRARPSPSAQHSWQGFSTGEWEGDMLKVTTTHLKEGWIRRNGVPRSEKATLVSEKRNQVVFKVLRDSTKPEIKAAVELMFPKTEVASVQTTVQKGKSKRFGRSMGRRDHVKKAYVTLKPGHELNFSGEGA